MIELKTGDILNVHTPCNLLKPSRWVSGAIRAVETLRWGKYAWASHSALIIKENGQIWVYEADPIVKKTLLKDWVEDKQVSVTRFPSIIFPQFLEDKMIKVCNSELGTKYNYWGTLFYQPIYILTGKWFGPKGTDTVYCSEFLCYIFKEVLGLYKDFYEVSPASLYEDTVNFEVFKGEAKNLI